MPKIAEELKKLHNGVIAPSAGKRGFRSADGKGMPEIKELVYSEGWEIYKFKGKKAAGKFVFVNPDQKAFIIKHVGKIGLLYDAITKNGLEKFIKKNSIHETTRQELIDEKSIKVSRALVKSQHKGKIARVEEITNRKMEIAIRIMHYSFKRGSAEHLKLREELYALKEEMDALSSYNKKISAAVISQEHLSLARKVKEKKKKERAIAKRLKKLSDGENL